jgi:hypothetical protein
MSPYFQFPQRRRGIHADGDLDFVKQAWPRLPAIGFDLSEAYVRDAKRHLTRWS